MNNPTQLTFASNRNSRIQIMGIIFACLWIGYNLYTMIIQGGQALIQNLFFQILIIVLMVVMSNITKTILRVQFDDDSKTLILTYLKFYFLKRDKTFDYNTILYSGFDQMGVLKSTPTSISNLKFYHHNTFIGEIMSRRIGAFQQEWQSEQLEEIHAKLQTFAREYSDNTRSK